MGQLSDQRKISENCPNIGAPCTTKQQLSEDHFYSLLRGLHPGMYGVTRGVFTPVYILDTWEARDLRFIATIKYAMVPTGTR